MAEPTGTPETTGTSAGQDGQTSGAGSEGRAAPPATLGQFLGNVDVGSDILERALHAANNLVVLTDPRLPDNPIVWVNDYFVEFTGYERAEIVGKNCRLLQGEDRDQPSRDALRQAIDADDSVHVVIRNYKKNGDLFWNDLYVSPVRDDSGEIVYFVGIQNDVTPAETSRVAVADAERRLHDAEASAMEMFGQDLHDGPLQTMAGLELTAGALQNALAKDDLVTAHRLVAQLVRFAGAASVETRALSQRLQPVEAIPSGLAHALERLAAQVNAETAGHPTVAAFVRGVEVADHRMAVSMYRVAQEAINNAVRHAGAETVTVTLVPTPKAVLLEVRDDGNGRATADGETDRGSAERRGRPMGLSGMRLRADHIGGQITVHSTPETGTLVRLRVPTA